MLASIAEFFGDITAEHVAFATVFAGVIASFLSLRRNINQVNEAVNGNPKGTPRIYDLVEALDNRFKSVEAWVEGWDSSPWTDGDDVRNYVTQREESDKALLSELRKLRAEVRGEKQG